MNIYDLFMKPIEALFLGKIRAELISMAERDVLELGIGTGANLKYYDHKKVKSITGLDKEYSQELDRLKPENFSFSQGSMEDLPFDEESFDTVVTSLVLCTVDMEKSLAEIKRVLKPGGTFIFMEHIRPENKRVGKTFDQLNRLWPKLAQGCNLNRRSDLVLKESGFSQLNIKRKCANIFYYGYAKK